MSVSFCWRIIPEKSAPSFGAGTSSDVEVLKNNFNNEVSTHNMAMLRAMHDATGQEKSLWGEIYRTLERLQGDDYGKIVKLSVWPEW
jgi:hypothetical protein